MLSGKETCKIKDVLSLLGNLELLKLVISNLATQKFFWSTTFLWAQRKLSSNVHENCTWLFGFEIFKVRYLINLFLGFRFRAGVSATPIWQQSNRNSPDQMWLWSQICPSGRAICVNYLDSNGLGQKKNVSSKTNSAKIWYTDWAR